MYPPAWAITSPEFLSVMKLWQMVLQIGRNSSNGTCTRTWSKLVLRAHYC
jgi:hypothetical protein